MYGDCFVHQFNQLCLTHYPEMNETNISNNSIKKCDEQSNMKTIKFRQVTNNSSLSSKVLLKVDYFFENENQNNFKKRRSSIKINYGISKKKIYINQQERDNQNNFINFSKSSHLTTIGKLKILSNLNDNTINLKSLYNSFI